MAWEKRGLIFAPDGSTDWARNSFMTPTPWQLDRDTIRLFGGLRDDAGVSRLGWVDVESENPSVVKGFSATPLLDVGLPGAFDDNGVIMGDVVDAGDGRVFLYFVGFQLVRRAKFLAFTGLATSADGGRTFRRHQNTPVLDRIDSGLYIRAAHTVMREGGRWRAWLGEGSGWRVINGVDYPAYEVWYAESEDGIRFPGPDRLVVAPGPGEYRLGRPLVAPAGDGLEMYFTFDTTDKQYGAGRATSRDGVEWLRDAGPFPVPRSAEGWDAEMVCYTAPHRTPQGRQYLFYNGNGMGLTGVGYAEWRE